MDLHPVHFALCGETSCDAEARGFVVSAP